MDDICVICSLVWRYRQMNEILYAGLIVLVVTVGKLFLLDLPEVSMMIRAVLFLIVGSIGIVISRMFFSKEEKKKAIHVWIAFFIIFINRYSFIIFRCCILT